MSDSENTSTEKPAKRGSLVAGLAVLLSLSALSISGWLWYSLAYRNAELFNQSIPQRVENLRSEISNLQSVSKENTKSIESLGKGQQVLAEATKKAYSEINRNRNKWAVSEIEQLLIIANQRLQLANDFETAAIALRAADNRLAALADPVLTPVRKKLAAEINQLKSYEQTDISGISLQLIGLIDNVENLPLSLKVSYQQTDKEGMSSTEQAKPATGFFAELWQDIRGLVTMRNNIESHKPLLPPAQQYFLRENLRLLLLGAQQALLRNEREVYKHNLESARRWVKDYFDTHTQAIRQLNEQIDALLKTKLVKKNPDISGSLSLLRKLAQDSTK